ncbi:MAG: epoxyqueuosine reductase [Syntrophomonas sp.]|nr:epoxyqueuosine reductase [Syntrophomonas sp.]
MRARIKEFALSLGVDAVGIANAADYKSPRSPDLQEIFPEVGSLVVTMMREGSQIESPNPRIAMSGRIDMIEFMRGVNLKLSRFLEKECGARAMGVPFSYPLNMGEGKMGLIGDVSLRHAAVAAGLGNFGRNNLVLNPEFGSRVLFGAVLCDLDLASDPPCIEEVCTYCDICVEDCPAGALDEEGRTDPMKCLKVSQPYGIGKAIGFWNQVLKKSPEEQKRMLVSEDFMSLYQAQSIGFQYNCFKCYAGCPLNK